MKTPNDVVRGRIVDIDEHGMVTIKARYDDIYTLIKREYKECNVQMIDSRPLSDKQRRACYALLGEIAEYSGMSKGQTKELMKIKFLADELQETADSIFSLANAPMSLVCAFQRYLVRFIIEWEIPCSFPLLDFVDDTADYIYSCLIHKKCCICGRRADLHHVDHVGMGRDRAEIIHEGMEVLPLCREHHTEAHTIGQKTFNSKWHIERGVKVDTAVSRLYRLKTGRQKNEGQTTSV
jgi:hypothetical protein